MVGKYWTGLSAGPTYGPANTGRWCLG